MQRCKKLVNENESAVKHAIDGLLLSNSNLSRVGELNVVVRSDIGKIKNEQVTLICGGGSGHEPAHAGYIGNGMLSGAVLGNVFASPSVSLILAAIRVCAGTHGVLVIVKNYTGDRLNFGMAVERARSEGLKAEMVVVEDDCALPLGKGITGGRGVAGTIFVHKVAGAAAVAGCSLSDVRAKAVLASEKIGTLGMALSICTLPGCLPANRLKTDCMEMAIGIHGEPGSVVEIADNAKLSEQVTNELLTGILDGERNTKCPFATVEFPVALMINNLGGLSELEMTVVTRDAITNIRRRGYSVVRCYTGSFMTSLDMAGVSLSVFSLNEDLLQYLDAATVAPAWKASSVLNDVVAKQIIAYSQQEEKVVVPAAGPPCPFGNTVLSAICTTIVANEGLLTEYDSKCGDGDCGIVMKAACTHILSVITSTSLDVSSSSSLCVGLADAVSASMGGTSGAVLEIMLRAMATDFITADNTGTSVVRWAHALQAGTIAIQKYGGATVGMRTLLDALVPAVDAMSTSRADPLAEAVAAAESGMLKTKTMLSLAGRSNYVAAEAMDGIPDPGAYAVFLAFKAAHASLQ